MAKLCVSSHWLMAVSFRLIANGEIQVDASHCEKLYNMSDISNLFPVPDRSGRVAWDLSKSGSLAELITVTRNVTPVTPACLCPRPLAREAAFAKPLN